MINGCAACTTSTAPASASIGGHSNRCHRKFNARTGTRRSITRAPSRSAVPASGRSLHELVKAATEYFPNLTIIARAFDRRHAYELVRVGGDEVVRETFESALVFGKKALLRLGMSDRRAAKAVNLFREHDLALFNKLAPVYGEEERYAMAVRDSRATMENLLSAEMRRLKKEEAEEADNDGKEKALREAS